MGGGPSAAGFLSAFSDAAKKKADEAHDANAAQKKSQADIYWGVIKNPDSTPDQINYAHDQLGKLYPKDPQIKQLFDKFRGIIQQTHPGHQAAQDPNAPPAPGGGGAIPPPPQPAGAAPAGAAAPTATGTIATPPFLPSQKSAIPPPPVPGATPIPNARAGERPTPSPIPNATPGDRNVKPQPLASKGQDPRFAEMAKAAGSTAGEEAKKRNEWDRQEKIKHDYKMLELDEAAKAKATNPTGRATAISPISMSEARKMAAAGQTFTAADGGDPLTLDDYDDTMMLVPLQQNGRIVGYSPASQRQTHLTYNNKVIAVPSLNQMDANVKGTELGQAQVGATTKTTDPATGQTTTAVRTPNAPAAAGGAAPSAAPKPAGTPAAAPPGKSAPIAKSAPSTGPSTPSASAPTQAAPRGLPPLDADGHIPAVAPYAPQVIAGANDLLEGRAVKDIAGTSKTKGLSEQLARKYGWEQGLFTPKERLQLGESSHFIDKFAASDSLSTLEEGNFHRARISQILAGSKEQGATGTLGTIFASDTDDPKVKEFVDLYNQTVQTIAGLRQITSPGRATEAAIQRLLADLPNPKTTNSVADAHRKLGLIQEEIAYAQKFGKWKDPGAEGTTSKRKSAIAAPPKPGGSSAGNVVHWTRDDNGNPVPAP